ncbi:MAG TPA: hypothetical protein EYO84_06180 [Planctomycetes bacterium]|nr:hypothetical protein [Planctomycetota bacterium]
MSFKKEDSDLTQILLLTLFLCSAVFGAWGWWIKTEAQEYRRATETEALNFNSLKDLLASAESKEAVLDHRRREESKRNASKTSSIIASIISDMSKSAAKPEIISSRTDKSPPVGGLTKHTYLATFGVKPLRDQIVFLERIRSRAPHLGFEKLELSNTNKNKKGGSSSDTWGLTVKLVSYSGEAPADNSE